jgi:hypothetical protein
MREMRKIELKMAIEDTIKNGNHPYSEAHIGSLMPIAYVGFEGMMKAL